MLNSIRSRLMLWNIGIMGLLLIVFTLVLFLGLQQSFDLHERFILTDWINIIVDALQKGTAKAPAAQVDSQIGKLWLPERHVFVAHLIRNSAQSVCVYGCVTDVIIPQTLQSLQNGEIRFVNTTTRYSPKFGIDRRLMVMTRVRLPANGEDYFVITSRSLDPLQAEFQACERLLAFLFPTGLLLTGIAAWFLVGKSLDPVAKMSQSARQIEAGDLDQRLPVANPHDELGMLATTFNDLIARLGKSFHLQRQFMADASHELRTPVSAIRTAADVTLSSHSRSEEEYRGALEIVEAQSTRITNIVNDMFELTRADCGGLRLRRNLFYLDELIEQTVRGMKMLAAHKGIRLQAAAAEECLFSGDPDLLQRMFTSLLENAIKFTPQHGKVRIELQQSQTMCTVRVADTGSGIAAENQERIFQRFFRERVSADENHRREESGAGLGLSIAQTIAQSHGGSLRLETSSPSGSIFVAYLPREAA